MQHIALKNLNQISHIALDIETIPNRPLTDYEPPIQEYINRKLVKARSCCVSRSRNATKGLRTSRNSWGLMFLSPIGSCAVNDN